jgi:UDP-N-acetylmuramyl tripeptide synthase
MIRYAFAVAIGHVVRWVARIRRRGGGSAIPGVIVNKIAPGFLPSVLNSFPDGLVIVSGTAGKSTTTRLLAAIVSAHGKKVFTNPSTANISQGLTSAVLAQCSALGRISADIAILEMDEGHAAKLSAKAHPQVSVLLNVCVDQIDRFYDPLLVTNMLGTVAEHTTQAIVWNRDDGNIKVAASRALQAQSHTFGFGPELVTSSLTLMGYVRPSRSNQISTDADTVLKSSHGRQAKARVGNRDLDLVLPSSGLHYGVDAVAALSSAQAILGSSFNVDLAVRTISQAEPVFGRGETVIIDGQELDFVLIQNPTSLRLNLQSIPAETSDIMFAVGSDVRDYSYLWSVQLSSLKSLAFAAGPQAREVAVHALYSGVDVQTVEPDLLAALDRFIAAPAPRHGRKTIIFSADSMRRTRRHFGLAEQGVH